MPQRRDFGQIRKLPSGRYQARYQVPGSERVVSAPTTFETKDLASMWLARQRVDIADKVLNPTASVTTFGEYAESWLAGRDVKETTRTLYRRQLTRDLLPTWGSVLLSEITPAKVRAWHSKLLPERPTQRAHVYALFRTILNTAWQDDLIPSNPCRVRGAGSTKRARTITPATLEELQTLAAAVPEQYQLLVLLGAWCQVRFGEGTALQRGDITVAEMCTVKVRRGVTWMTGTPLVDTPKTAAAVRDVVAPPHLTGVIERHLSTIPKKATTWLFPSQRNPSVPISPHEFRPLFDQAKKKAGRPDLTFHQLRHTGAVLAALSGATVKELMERLGHTTPEMSLRYQHVAADRDRVLAASLSRLATGAAPE